jgi:hypothetical protein
MTVTFRNPIALPGRIFFARRVSRHLDDRVIPNASFCKESRMLPWRRCDLSAAPTPLSLSSSNQVRSAAHYRAQALLIQPPRDSIHRSIVVRPVWPLSGAGTMHFCYDTTGRLFVFASDSRSVRKVECYHGADANSLLAAPAPLSRSSSSVRVASHYLAQACGHVAASINTRLSTARLIDSSSI